MRLTILAFLVTLFAGSLFAQKPDWVDNPGKHAKDNFISIGVSKNKKVDKARKQAEKRARKGMRKLLKKKYDKDKIKKAMAHIVFESYWTNSQKKYTYVLAKLPFEHVDSGVAGSKLLNKAKSSMMGASDIMKDKMKEPSYIVVDDDEEEDE